jgi:hypothetical protein
MTKDARIEMLEAWIIGDCTCPCCQETRECSEGCTFAEDCPQDAERMHEARGVMWGA